jgi:hypothetical protein
MTSFVTPSFPTEHQGVTRMEAAAESAVNLSRRLSGARVLSAVLLLSMATAVLVAAYQVMDTVAEGHLLVLWTGAWLAGFAALPWLAGALRKLASGLKLRLDAWSRRVAESRAEQRLWAMAQQDPRVMADLQAAKGRGV